MAKRNNTNADDAIAGTSSRERIYKILLVLLAGTSKQKKKNGVELFREAVAKFPSHVGTGSGKIPETTFRQTLSGLAKDSDSLIVRGAGEHGYYLLGEEDLPQATADSVRQQSSKKRKSQSAVPAVNEKDLYPVVQEWLKNEQRYQWAENVSMKKKNGKWGHPDVVGITAHTVFNTVNVDVCTIEIKRNADNWRQWIFEAVAHRRFANKSYFAMLVDADLVEKFAQEIEPYCDSYGIGLLLLVPSNQSESEGRYTVKTASKKLLSLDILKVHYSRNQVVNPALQQQYLEAIDINGVDTLLST